MQDRLLIIITELAQASTDVVLPLADTATVAPFK
jgi:hypothetical protein